MRAVVAYFRNAYIALARVLPSRSALQHFLSTTRPLHKHDALLHDDATPLEQYFNRLTRSWAGWPAARSRHHPAEPWWAWRVNGDSAPTSMITTTLPCRASSRRGPACSWGLRRPRDALSWEERTCLCRATVETRYPLTGLRKGALGPRLSYSLRSLPGLAAGATFRPPSKIARPLPLRAPAALHFI